MSYFRVCPYCGAHLDPGEACGCQDKEYAPAGATNADKGTGKTAFVCAIAEAIREGADQ